MHSSRHHPMQLPMHFPNLLTFSLLTTNIHTIKVHFLFSGNRLSILVIATLSMMGLVKACAALQRRPNKCVVTLTLKSTLMVGKGWFTSVESAVMSCMFRQRFLSKILKTHKHHQTSVLFGSSCPTSETLFFYLVVVLYSVVVVSIINVTKATESLMTVDISMTVTKTVIARAPCYILYLPPNTNSRSMPLGFPRSPVAHVTVIKINKRSHPPCLFVFIIALVSTDRCQASSW